MTVLLLVSNKNVVFGILKASHFLQYNAFSRERVDVRLKVISRKLLKERWKRREGKKEGGREDKRRKYGRKIRKEGGEGRKEGT